MATYNPQRKTNEGTENVEFPISAIEGLADALNGKMPYLEIDITNMTMWEFKTVVENAGLLEQRFVAKILQYSSVYIWLVKVGNAYSDYFYASASDLTTPGFPFFESAIFNSTSTTTVLDWQNNNPLYLQSKTDDTLSTTDKTIVGAINEVNEKTAQIVTTTGTGEAYEATVAGITELKAGVSFVMIPHTNSTTIGVTLNVNGLGAKSIMRPASRRDLNTRSYSSPKDYFRASRIYRVIYDGTYWLLEGDLQPTATDLYGVVPVANGGVPTTSADNAGKVLTTNSSGTPEWQTPSSSGGGEIDTSNLATVDKITHFEQPVNDEEVYHYNDGIVFGSTSYFTTEDGEDHEFTSVFRVPIVAGENINFELDEENQVVKVNSPESMVGTWVFNDELTLLDFTANFNFISNGVTYIQMTIVDGFYLEYVNNDYTSLVYDDGSWAEDVYKTINILTEPPAEASAWIKANAKRYQPIGVDKIAGIDTFFWGASNVSDDLDGISWKDGFALFDENYHEIKQGYILQKIPLTAGENVTFSYDEENNAIAINATGGGNSSTDDSMIGTWVLNEEIPYQEGFTTDYEFSFTSRDLLFSGIGIEDIGYTILHFYGVDDNDTRNAIYDDGWEWTDDNGGSDWRYINILEEPSAEAAEWIRANAKKKSGSSTPFELPRIRFANFKKIKDETFGTTTFRFTVENLGGGTLKAGDELQICCKRKYPRGKIKLRAMMSQIISEEDLNQRFLKIEVDPSDEDNQKWLFRNNRVGNSTLSAMYFRLKRVTKYDGDGMECNAIFSNIETVWKTYNTNFTLGDWDGNYEFRIK